MGSRSRLRDLLSAVERARCRRDPCWCAVHVPLSLKGLVLQRTAFRCTPSPLLGAVGVLPVYVRLSQQSTTVCHSTGRKMALALREFALGVESLEQFVQHAPLRRVHQAAFGVLALESEPLDPRL